MKINIGYIISTLRSSGPVMQLLNIVKYLNRDNFNPIVITLSPEGDALLAVNGDLTFDDLFDIKLFINDSVFEYLWEDSAELQQEYPNSEDFYKYLETCENQKDLDRFEDIWYDTRWDCYISFYDGYSVTLKPGIEKTEKLEQAIRAIHTLDSIFDHEVSYG